VTPLSREQLTAICANCGKPIHYEADLQSWRHDDDLSDRCHGLPGKKFATPQVQS
jgi:hypothetical protein